MSSPAAFPNFASIVTNNAIKSGNASDSSVWSRPLSDGDFLGIPEGITVEWDLTSCPRLNGLYIKGTFNASNTAADLILNVGTIFVDMSGNWLCGDCMSETPLMGTFLVKFLDIPINEDFDPGHFGTGFLTMGANINMCGASEKTAFSKLDSIHAGDTIINCLEDIIG